jgi:ATP synthase protein I
LGRYNKEETDGITMNEKPPSPTVLGMVGALSGMGFTIAIPIAAGAIGGYYLDGYLHTKPLFILLGLLLGLIVGIFGAYRLYKAVFRS